STKPSGSCARGWKRRRQSRQRPAEKPARCCSRSPARRRSSRRRRSRGSNAVVLPEQASPAVDAFRAPLSSIRDAGLVVVVGDEAVEERAPVVALWVKAARRKGAEVITVGAAGSVQAEPGTAAQIVREQAGERIRAAAQPVLIWSGPGGEGGAVVAQLAHELGAAAAFYLPATPNGRAVAEAWHRAGEGEPTQPDELGVLLISGDEALA